MEKQAIREAMLEMEIARKRILQPAFQKLGLTVGQPRILNKLYEQDHITQKELADKCFLDTATISRNLDRLEKAGYITREKHPGCRRSFLIVLTEKGRVCAARVHGNFVRLDEQICQNLTKQEMQSFLDCAKKIVTSLKLPPALLESADTAGEASPPGCS